MRSDIACSANVCVEGHCVSRTTPGVCAAGSWCDPTMGCRVDPFDAGPPDAGPVDAPVGIDVPRPPGCTSPCNDGDPCTHGDGCVGARCAGTPIDCTMSDECNDYACNGGPNCTRTIHNGRDCTDDGNPCTSDTCERVFLHADALPQVREASRALSRLTNPTQHADTAFNRGSAQLANGALLQAAEGADLRRESPRIKICSVNRICRRGASPFSC